MKTLTELLNPTRLSFNIHNPPTLEQINLNITIVKKDRNFLAVCYPILILFSMLLPTLFGNDFPTWLLTLYFIGVTIVAIYIGLKISEIFSYTNSLLEIKSDEYLELTEAIRKSNHEQIRKTVTIYLSRTITNRKLTFHEYQQLIDILIKAEKLARSPI